MELARFPSRGGISVRSIFTFVLTVVITALLWIVLAAHPAKAELGGQTTASWQGGGNVLLYGTHSYTYTPDARDSSDTIPANAAVYQTAVQTDARAASSQKVLVIYFSPGVDPPTATNARQVEFSYSQGTLSNPQDAKDITVEPQDVNGQSGSSCAVGGIGWIICPVSEFLADAMDNIFTILSQFIAVQPSVLGDSSNNMYVAWNMMRTIANVAFVIVFLVIIYSQLTNLGVSNYGLKRLLPRLIVAAVLVNISYFITALAIDVSNILGYSVQNIFNIIREQTFHLSNDDIGGFAQTGWSAVTAVALGGAGAIGGIYYVAAGGYYLLIPILLGVLLTVLFVVVILAARQAIIVILVIIAPLAFVANLLPNTEKLFTKWKDLTITMLVFFPAFSLVFGGSQLAGQVIIQNAGDNFVMLIFGMAVQVAPLVITPLILKLSGGLLGRIAQITNNPRKGLIDRSRNWSERRAEHAKQQNIARGLMWKNDHGKRRVNPTALGAGMVRRMDYRKRRLNDSTDIWKQEATNRYEQTPQYTKLFERKSTAELDKERIHNQHATHVERLKGAEGRGTRVYRSAMNAQVSKDVLESYQQDTAAHYNEQRMNSLTQLGTAAMRLETSKLDAAGWQSRYETHIDTLKTAATSPLHNAARFAQSGKEHAEAAQSRVQAMFDRDRTIQGSNLHASTIDLESAKMAAELAQTRATEYLNIQKTTAGNPLHLSKVRLEDAKLSTQISETALTRTIEEYKIGRLERQGELGELSTSMTENIAVEAAQARGLQAAQNIQKRVINEAFTEVVAEMGSDGTERMVDSPRANTLLDIAGGVDENGRIRAKAAATTQLSKIEQEALENNITLLEGQAVEAGVNDIEWSRSIFQRHIGEMVDPTDPTRKRKLPAQPQDPALLEAALQKLAADGDINVVRTALMTKLGGSGDEYKPMLTRVVARTANTLKAKGGFDIQQKMAKLWGVDRAAMDISIAGSLGAITAENIPGQKWGWWHSLISPDENGIVSLARIINNVEAMPESADKAFTKKMLQSFYSNLTTTLTTQDIMAKIGDRRDDTADMHALLHNVPGLIQQPVTIDYAKVKSGTASKVK